MNYLTLIMAIPLLGAALIATLPQSKSLLAKQFALGTTLVAAVATIFMTTKFEPILLCNLLKVMTGLKLLVSSTQLVSMALHSY
jgi:NADH:ubiquinone oxidoreductase subunit 4 (subunit M)